MKINKYGNKWTEYAGIKFQSKAEANYCAELDLRVRIGDIKSYRRQVPKQIIVNGNKVCRLVLDFELFHNDGSVEYIDVKGFETPVFKLKWKLFDACYPQEKKTIVR